MACPDPSLRSSALGLGSNVGCCPISCPKQPLSNVVICVKVNRNSMATFQVGCSAGVDAYGDCIIDWSPLVVSESSWGKSSRVVTYSQTVQQDSFIRVSICAAPGSCSAALCGVQYEGTTPVNNELLKYTINGFDIKGYLTSVIGTSTANTVEDGCVIISNTSTCQTGNLSLANLEWGTSIIVGPIGNRAWSKYPVLVMNTQPTDSSEETPTYSASVKSSPAVVGIPVYVQWQYVLAATGGGVPSPANWANITATTSGSIPGYSSAPVTTTYTGAAAVSIDLTGGRGVSQNGTYYYVRAVFSNPVYFPAPVYSDPADNTLAP